VTLSSLHKIQAGFQVKRWFEESDQDVEELATAAVRAIEDWLDEDTVEFEGGSWSYWSMS